MASIRTIVFIALAAVAVQSAVGWDFRIPGLLGGSLGFSSLQSSKDIGGKVKLEDGGATGTIELGPIGGIQTRIVAPVLPNIANLLKTVQETVNKITGRITNRLGRIGGWLSSTVGKFNPFNIPLPKCKLWEAIVNNFPFNIDGVKGKITDLVTKAGGILDRAVKSGALSLKEAGNVASAILKSAIKSTINNISKLIDALQWAVKQKILLEKKAIQLLVKGIQAGLHTADDASKAALDNFLSKATKAGDITQDVANKLKDFINSPFKKDDEKKEDPKDADEKKPEDNAEKKPQEEGQTKPDTDAEKKPEEAEKKPEEEAEKKPEEEAEKKPEEEAEKKPEEEADKKPEEEAEKKPEEEAEAEKKPE